MQRILRASFIAVLLIMMVGCSIFQDVRQARDIIQTDNELAWLLMEVRPDDPTGAAKYLVGLAAHAEQEAKTIVENKGKKLDAISYYRIAATAYWRSGSPDAINSLFNCVEGGRQLCTAMGNDSPERDCLFLEIVIPLSGVESYFKNFQGAQEALEKVDFNDGIASPKEIKTMNEVYDDLKKQHNLLMQIQGLGNNPRLKNHPGMCKYYLAAGNMIVSGYNNLVSDFFLGHAQSYKEKIGRGDIVDYQVALKLRVDEFPTKCNGD